MKQSTTGSKKGKNVKPKIIKITPEQLHQLTEAIRASNLDPKIGEMLIDNISGNQWLVVALEKGQLSIKKLRALFNITTESSKNRKPQSDTALDDTEPTTAEPGASNDNNDDDSASKPEKRKGHGRIKASAYEGAEIIEVLHPDLTRGGPCPEEFCDGKLYELSEPGIMLQITGSPSAKATHYQLQKLRCSVCEFIFTAPLPEGVEEVKYTTSLIAMLMINKYFMSIPLYRQENLQSYLGVPLPASTQWELMAKHENVLKALYHAFEYDGAQARGVSIDDTKARILEQIAKNKKAQKKSDKASCFTTGIVCAHDDHMSYIFVTDNQTAGKSVAPFLRLRDPKLPVPYLMCDALTANIPHEISENLYLLCHCLTHARRQFYELPNGYDDLADEVMRMIGKIYDYDALTKTMSAEERLAYHQQYSQPIMDELYAYLSKQEKEFEPNGVAGCAINYILKRWTQLTQFLRHAYIPLDTNLTERALKLIIQIRKSCMFYKTLNSAKIASYIQTALYSAAQNEVNPYQYIKAILDNKESVIKAPDKWLPWNYHAALAQLEPGSSLQEGVISPGCP
ncbi:MAG: IS66 family transposase [Chitinophagia bacterium]|jgi:transposase|nr:IS66 family transposase [Chitinophagia bacterium]